MFSQVSTIKRLDQKLRVALQNREYQQAMRVLLAQPSVEMEVEEEEEEEGQGGTWGALIDKVASLDSIRFRVKQVEYLRLVLGADDTAEASPHLLALLSPGLRDRLATPHRHTLLQAPTTLML